MVGRQCPDCVGRLLKLQRVESYHQSFKPHPASRADQISSRHELIPMESSRGVDSGYGFGY